MFGRATIRLGIGPHSSLYCFAVSKSGLRIFIHKCWTSALGDSAAFSGRYLTGLGVASVAAVTVVPVER